MVLGSLVVFGTVAGKGTLMVLAEILRHQRDHRIDNNAYRLIQCDFAFNSNHIEGSTLSHDQTVTIFDRNVVSGTARVDDIVEARNHFSLVDFVLDSIDEPLTCDYVKHLHYILKHGTSAEEDPLQEVGAFKRLDNVIAGEIRATETARPDDVQPLLDRLFVETESSKVDLGTIEGLAEFHWRFESIHPFSDGNGRIGRVLLFKESLRRDATPPLVREEVRDFYLRGLREYEREPGYLIDTLGWCQDDFETRYLPLMRRYERSIEAILQDGQEEGPDGRSPSSPPATDAMGEVSDYGSPDVARPSRGGKGPRIRSEISSER